MIFSKKLGIALGLLAGTLTACQVSTPPPPEPYGALPSERQLRWHEMETYTLIHFTPTTYQNKEWGFGDADPAIFNPTEFDANQIANAAAAGGFKGLISVAKHHDGFCLWPTATTNYSVAQSPWRDGKGDMVKEFMGAAKKANLAFGVYLSAWDRNDIRYGSEAYPEAYRQQLTELMTGYGDLFTSWHDGANGGDGYYGGRNEKRLIDRSSYYNWKDKTWPIVREHQPMAMIFSDIGPDMRWVGNEHGHAAETSWATITLKGIEGKEPMPGYLDDSNLTTGTRGGESWIPAECDVPHRSGWFYHPEQDAQVKSPDALFEIYLKSVGRGANMNLGLAPMPNGQLHANDVASLKGFGEKLEKTFSSNLASKAKITTSNTRGDHKAYSADQILDDDRYSYYASDDDVLNPSLELDLGGEQEFDLIRLRENIKLGQRLDSVRISTWDGQDWQKIAGATSIGATRIIKLSEPVRATKVRIELFAPVAPTLSDFGLYKEAHVAYDIDQSPSAIVRVPSNSVKLTTGDGLAAAMDRNPVTFSELSEKIFVFDIGTQTIGGFFYLPRQDGKKEGMVTRYRLSGSQDNAKWEIIKEGEFSNIKSNPIEQVVRFSKNVQYKYIKFEATETVERGFSASELGFIK
ncbi:alpha-L-fucosidase [Sphingobacterium sp. lm-10]|uniref:alpha-L-fucosidase n=1 Tax=Sphingobacterium sp. lm-10 TaxID=2944904 RepID=UPI002021A28B|nr:alpha-L-fucosidase [Sphingobacterium sp. lm-10]MCL7988866.1 alpha-L-fucosidase [Sphingobacterium sp. lm-10]